MFQDWRMNKTVKSVGYPPVWKWEPQLEHEISQLPEVAQQCAQGRRWLLQWRHRRVKVPDGPLLLLPRFVPRPVGHLPSSPSIPSKKYVDQNMLYVCTDVCLVVTSGSPGLLRKPTTRTALTSAGIASSRYELMADGSALTSEPSVVCDDLLLWFSAMVSWVFSRN